MRLFKPFRTLAAATGVALTGAAAWAQDLGDAAVAATVDGLPMTPTQKVQKHLLREQGVARDRVANGGGQEEQSSATIVDDRPRDTDDQEGRDK